MTATDTRSWASSTPGSDGRIHDTRPTKAVFSWASNSTKRLVQQDVAMVKSEVKESVAAGVRSGIFFSGGGLMAILALQALVLAAGFALATVVSVGLAFAILGVFFLFVTAAFILIGRRKLAQVKAPTDSISMLKDDVATATRAFKEGLRQ